MRSYSSRVSKSTIVDGSTSTGATSSPSKRSLTARSCVRPISARRRRSSAVGQAAQRNWSLPRSSAPAAGRPEARQAAMSSRRWAAGTSGMSPARISVTSDSPIAWAAASIPASGPENSGSSLTFPTDSASAAVSPSSVPATHTFASGTAARTVPRILEITVCPPRLTPGLWTPPNRRERPPLRIITVIDMVRSYAFLRTVESITEVYPKSLRDLVRRCFSPCSGAPVGLGD